MKVAGDRVEPRAGDDGVELDVARDRRHRRETLRLAEPGISGDGVDRCRAADSVDGHVAGGRLDVQRPRDRPRVQIAARRGERQLADVAHADVAGRGADTDGAEAPVPVEVGALGREVHVGVLRAADLHVELRPTAEEPAALLLRDANRDLVAAAALDELDPRLRGRSRGGVVAACRADVDVDPGLVPRCDGHLASRHLDVECDAARCLEGRHGSARAAAGRDGGAGVDATVAAAARPAALDGVGIERAEECEREHGVLLSFR